MHKQWIFKDFFIDDFLFFSVIYLKKISFSFHLCLFVLVPVICCIREWPHVRVGTIETHNSLDYCTE